MSRADERRWDTIKADRSIIDGAATRLRHEAQQAHYAGLARPEVAYGLAAILDELSRHVEDVPTSVRWQALDACRDVLGLPLS